MVGTEDNSASSRDTYQLSGTLPRKAFWRSASWSASCSFPLNPGTEDKDTADPNGSGNNGNGQNKRFPVPLTPRSQQNCKARSCLPPLQPLSIARRSVDEWPKAGSDDIGEWPQPPTPSGRENGERLKIDLSKIQKNQDKSGGLVKRDKIAFFDKECSKVAEHVYLGGDAVARDRDILKQNGITHILNCVGFVCPEYFKDDFVYRTLWLQDSPSEDITSILYDVFDYFEDVREQGGRIFVHCCQGVSRSTSLVIAYLMWREGQSFDDAFQYVKAARGIADPNMGFACQLLRCQKRVHAFPLSPSSILRMYRIAPHSSYDPVHLVPKMLNDPSPFALDSRGAFIIHLPSMIYVWIGKNCEAVMERDALGAVCQIVRYERVQGPIKVIKEGEEPANFWDAFVNFLPSMDRSHKGVTIGESADKLCPGERKVELYDVDFEIFQKAIMGGFVPPIASSDNEHETHLPARESSWSVLRRKFASGNLKEFVLAPKISLSRAYSDSMMVVHSFAKSSSSPSSASLSSSLSTTSSSSPVFPSPDSLSSDSSTGSKYFSDSSLDFPSTASCSLPVTLSNSSNSSFLTSTSSLPISTSPISDVETSESSSQSFAIPSKKLSPSLAERRGSSSKPLKLPFTADKMRVTSTPSSFLGSRKDGDWITDATCSLNETHNMEIVVEPLNSVENEQKDSPQKCKDVENGVQDRETSPDSFKEEALFLNHYVKPWRNYPTPLGKGQLPPILNSVEELVSTQFMQPLVYRWPQLEKITAFDASYLNSKAVWAIFSREKGSAKKDGNILYLWIGSSFDGDDCKIRLDSDKEVDSLEKNDWNRVGRSVLTELGLPEDTEIKIFKEGEETEEFLALFSIL